MRPAWSRRSRGPCSQPGMVPRTSSGELEDFVFEEPGQVWVKPYPLTDPATPWLAKDPKTAVTGLDPDGRVQLEGDVKKDNSSRDVLRLSWAVALGYASPHIAVRGRRSGRGWRRRAGQPRHRRPGRDQAAGLVRERPHLHPPRQEDGGKG